MTTRRGFTFVELLVAMALLSVLSAIAVPRYRDYKLRAHVAAMKSDLGHLRISEEEHWAEHQRYSTDSTALGFRSTSDVRVEITSQDPIGGYTAIATHPMVPGQQCSTAMGRESAPREAGTIYCGAAGGGSATIPSVP